jgi:hypothetical protein
VPHFATPSLVHHLFYDHEQDLDGLMGKRSREPRKVLNRSVKGKARSSLAATPAPYFKERGARADVAKALEMLDRAGGEPPRQGDELPG